MELNTNDKRPDETKDYKKNHDIELNYIMNRDIDYDLAEAEELLNNKYQAF